MYCDGMGGLWYPCNYTLDCVVWETETLFCFCCKD